MSKAPMFTRTTTSTKCKVLTMNLAEERPEEIEMEIPGKYKDNKKLVAALREKIDSDERVFVSVKEAVIVNTLRGMTEEEFFAHSKVLPPRNVKTTETVDR